MFVQMIYQSKSRMRITAHDMVEIMQGAIPQNIEQQVTSYLYHDDWNYLHILEGKATQIVDTMKQITADKLHHSIKVRLMTECTKRNFQDWPLGVVSADDFELQRVMKNLGHKSVLDLNILDAVKVLKRTAGRKLRTMSVLEKRSLTDARNLELPKMKRNLTEDMLGLRS